MLRNYSPDQISAFWNGVTAFATIAAALVAIFTLRALRSDSSDRTRPLMTAELRPVPLLRGRSELVISNGGASVAKNVQVDFDPPLPDLNGPGAAGKMTPFLRRRYSKPITTWTPGMRFSNVYFAGVPGDNGTFMNNEPLPDEFTVTIQYEDAHRRHYSDRYDLSIGAWSDETFSHPGNTDEKGMQKRQIQAIEAIARGVGRH